MEIDRAGNDNPPDAVCDAEHETTSRIRLFRPLQSTEERLEGWPGERREWTAKEDEKSRNTIERSEGDQLKIGEHSKEQRVAELMNKWRNLINSCITEGPRTEKEDGKSIECINRIDTRNGIAIEKCIPRRTAEHCDKEFRLLDKAYLGGCKKYRARRFSESSSAGSLLQQKLRRLSLQDHSPAAAAASSSAMAPQCSEGIVEVVHQVEEAASECSRISALKKQIVSSQRTVRRIRSFRSWSTKVMLKRQGERREWAAEKDEKVRNTIERSEGERRKIGEDLKEQRKVEAIKGWRVIQSCAIKGLWTKKEDENLIECVNLIGPGNWIAIAGRIPGHTAEQCEKRWENDLKNNMNTKCRTEDSEFGRFRLWDKADWNGSRKYRDRGFRGLSSAGSVLPQELQRLSLQDREPAAAAASLSSGMALDSKGIVNDEKQVEEAASKCSRTS